MKPSEEEKKAMIIMKKGINTLGSEFSKFNTQIIIAEEHLHTFKEIVIKNLLKNNFNVKIVHDSIIVENEDENENS